MANPTLKATRIYSGQGKGFWVDLQNAITVANSILQNNNNTKADTGSTASEETAYDPAENTVTELQNTITSIIATL